jgi:monothiol glutaredoxin
MRNHLNEAQIDSKALAAMEKFHSGVVKEAQEAVQTNPVVVIGMAGNVFVKKARNLLNEKKIQYKYIEHGNYLSKWKERLALKLWSGWPTFPQVFVDGKLIGGFRELQNLDLSSKSSQNQ